MSRIYLGIWKIPEIPDSADYETITQITNTLKNKEKSVKSLFQICVIRAFWASPESSPGGQIDSSKRHGTSDQCDPIDGLAQKERGSNQCD